MSMCRVFSCVVGRGCLLWPVHFLGKTLLVFVLLHSVFQGQMPILLGNKKSIPRECTGCAKAQKQPCACVLSPFSYVWLFTTPVDQSLPGYSVHIGFSRHEYCPPPGDLPAPGIETVSLIYPAVAGGFFTTSVTWGAPKQHIIPFCGNQFRFYKI